MKLRELSDKSNLVGIQLKLSKTILKAIKKHNHGLGERVMYVTCDNTENFLMSPNDPNDISQELVGHCTLPPSFNKYCLLDCEVVQ